MNPKITELLYIFLIAVGVLTIILSWFIPFGTRWESIVRGIGTSLCPMGILGVLIQRYTQKKDYNDLVKSLKKEFASNIDDKDIIKELWNISSQDINIVLGKSNFDGKASYIDCRYISTLKSIIHILYSINLRAEIAFSDDEIKNYEGNFILLGNKQENSLFDRFIHFPSISTKLDFSIKDKKLYYKMPNGKFGCLEPTFDEHGRINTDYAIIMKAPNPYDQNSNIIFLYGCTLYGTLGAAMMVSSNRNINELTKSVSNLNFEAILEVTIGHTGNITNVRIYETDSQNFTNAIVPVRFIMK